MMKLIFLLGFLILTASQVGANFSLPPLPPREEYGTIIIDRQSSQNGQKPVVFSHWLHRSRFTCRVCHGELDFVMKTNATEITERGNRTGKFCGACHNGKIAFRHNGNCDKCHNGDVGYSSKKFEDFLLQNAMPMTATGNGVNWSEGLRNRIIKPQTYLKKKSQDMGFDKELLLEAEMTIIPPAVFPHKAHTAWLDCDNCHPDLFNIKKKGTHFTMPEILKGNYCGVCHLTVAFPMDECRRCHPDMREQQ
ncbi:MAG TPA: c(7)-type cytochrome triheme domain-containing protein [Geobacteraceae bacterium]|nr:c(7)-type cytochrome triheme domain-containing protein [Geobacteraceae bacterium]